MTPEIVVAAFSQQAKACAALGSPFMGQLCRLFAQNQWPDLAITQRVFAWSGDITPAGDSVPLRLAGALHALCINGDLRLSEVYPPKAADDAALWAAVTGAMAREETFIDAWLNSAPQTNEVRRSAILIAVGRLLSARYGLPMRTSELGASGGLNLNWDKYCLAIDGNRFGPMDVMTLSPDWDGPLPETAEPTITKRAGVDLNPLNPKVEQDALRLQAYLWPDQPERLARTNAAIAIADTAVEKADAIDWLRKRLDHVQGEIHLIYHTVAWQYFPQSAQVRGTKLIEAAGSLATNESPLAWFGMENDGTQQGAALTLRLWPGDITLNLGRADFHGRWVKWSGEC